MLVARSGLLNALESIMPGISSRDMVEQGTCAVFMGDRVCSYNDEIFCEYKLEDALNINGAVPIAPLRSMLHKLKEDSVDIRIEGSELLIKGKSGRESGIRIDEKIALPIEKVDKPEKYKKLPDTFAQAVLRAASCASTDSGLYNITCIHLTAKHLEATDNNHAIRYYMDLPIADPSMVRATSLAQIKLASPKSISITQSWVHFKNNLGLRMSIRKDATGGAHKYPDLTKLLEFKGKSITLPKSIGEACERAEIFSAEDAEMNLVKVEIAPGKPLRLRADGSSGWYQEKKEIEYDGPELKFMISPQLLAALVSESHPCKVDGHRLIMKSDSFSYVVALEAEATKPEEKETDDESDD
jgi:hypothetical protein